MNFRRFQLPFIAFMSGFSLMAFELIAARILAPSIGSSIYVWTSVIGIIIAAMSVGYWVGGKVSDLRHNFSDIAWLCLGTALTVLVCLVFYLPLIEVATDLLRDPRIQGVVVSLCLFAPTSFLIGVLSPYLVKMQVTSLKTTGQSFASLSTLESLGGISGTFITGFILFSYIGVREALMIIIVLLIGVSWCISPRKHVVMRLGVSMGLMVIAGALLFYQPKGQIETASAHYSIVNGVSSSGRPVRGIATGPNGTQSGVYVDAPNELLFWYTQQLATIVEQTEKRDRILVLGGGTFTLPRYLAQKYPRSQIDVVEIDDELVDIAREHFYYNDPVNIRIIPDDARRYVNTATQSYDIVLVDVYSDASVPFSLMSREYSDKLHRILAPQAIIGVNMIADTNGPCRELLRALDAPYRLLRSNVSYVQQQKGSRSNMVVVYSPMKTSIRGYSRLNLPMPPIYTDSFMPAEQLQHRCEKTDEA